MRMARKYRMFQEAGGIEAILTIETIAPHPRLRTSEISKKKIKKTFRYARELPATQSDGEFIVTLRHRSKQKSASQ